MKYQIISGVFVWLAVFIFYLQLLIVMSENGNHITIGNLEVDSPEDGMPSLDTGLYLMSQEAPFDGYVKSVNACAFLIEPNPNPQGTNEIILLFSAAGYRLMGNAFKKITATLDFSIIITAGEVFGCNVINLASGQQPMMLKGDRPGVFVLRQECIQFSFLPPTYLCSAYVNLIDPIMNCSQSLYFNNTSLEDEGMPTELTAINGHPVNVFINLDIIIESISPQNADSEELSEQNRPRICATKFESKTSQEALIRTVSIIALGIFLLLMISIACACTVVIVYCQNRRKVSSSSDVAIDDQLSLQYNTCYSPFGSNMEQRNATLMESTHSYVISSLGLLSCAESDEEQYQQPASKVKDLKYQLKNLKVNEILKDNIELKEYLGSGRFGVVYRGLLTVTGADSEGGIKEVAVKTMENGASEEDRVKFLQEAAIMGQFNNLYIVRIFGVLTSYNQPYMIICEFMNKGDLHRHLHNIKIKGYDIVKSEAGAMLLSYSRQVASAMVYLSGKGYVHCDLAARNILLSEDGVCKISDFGLSRNLQDEDYYVSKSGVIPLRWTAPEAFQDGKFSTASDVWSYGILLYEIWSLACKPYRNLTNELVIIKVLEGHRLPSPPGCPRAIYNKMISCWHPDTSSRSTFISVQISLQQPDYELLKWSEEDKAAYSDNARTIGATFQDGESLFKDMQTMYEVV